MLHVRSTWQHEGLSSGLIRTDQVGRRWSQVCSIPEAWPWMPWAESSIGPSLARRRSNEPTSTAPALKISSRVLTPRRRSASILGPDTTSLLVDRRSLLLYAGHNAEEKCGCEPSPHDACDPNHTIRLIYGRQSQNRWRDSARKGSVLGAILLEVLLLGATGLGTFAGRSFKVNRRAAADDAALPWPVRVHAFEE